MPLLTRADINNAVKSADFYRFPGTQRTVCRLQLDYGFDVIGTSACAIASEFDEVVGRTLAHEDAIRKVWELQTFLANWKAGAGMTAAEVVAPVAAAPEPELVIEAPAEPPTTPPAAAPEPVAQPEPMPEATGLSFADVLAAASIPAGIEFPPIEAPSA